MRAAASAYTAPVSARQRPDVQAIAPFSNMVKNNVKYCHCNGRDEFARSQCCRVGRQAVGTQRPGPGHQMKCIAAAQNDGHPAE